MPFTDSIKMVDVAIIEKESLNATPNDVIAGKEFIGLSKNIESGILSVLEDHVTDVTLNAGEIFVVQSGVNRYAYHVKATNLSDETIGNAVADDIIENKVAWVNGEKIIGAMQSNQATTITLNADQSYNIPKGYHTGLGKVAAKSLRDQTISSIQPKDIKINSNCWSNGEYIEGTMPAINASVQYLDAGTKYNIPEGYHSGLGSVIAKSLSDQTEGTATNNVIAGGYTAWVNGQKVTGTMPNNEAEEIVLPLNGTYEIPNGYHTGFGKVTQSIQSKDGQTIAPSKVSQTINTAGYYMTGNIIVTGIDGLNYSRSHNILKDSVGNQISNYELTVQDKNAIVPIFVDNWHDNSTLNVYNLICNSLIDADGISKQISCVIIIDWEQPSGFDVTIDGIEINLTIDSETNSQCLNIKNITSGNITLSEIFSAREFGSN